MRDNRQCVSDVVAAFSCVTKATTSHVHTSQGGYIPQVMPAGNNFIAEEEGRGDSGSEEQHPLNSTV